MSQIAVGLADQAAEWSAWFDELGGRPVSPSIISDGVVRVAMVSKWIGVPPPSPDMVEVKLNAPEPRPGEDPQWLEFRPGEWKPSPSWAYCCWTSDLIAVRWSPPGDGLQRD